jgi:hypothetical protein
VRKVYQIRNLRPQQTNRSKGTRLRTLGLRAIANWGSSRDRLSLMRRRTSLLPKCYRIENCTAGWISF